MNTRSKNENSLAMTGAITLAACMIYAVGAGIRSNYGIMLGAISENSGVSYSAVSFVLAIAQLVFGIMQPVFGIAAMKKSNPFVLVCGIVLMAGGLLMIPFCRSAVTLMIFLGILLPAGTAALSFGIIMGAITPKLRESHVSAVSGVVNASSGVGNTIMSPIIQLLIASAGLFGAMVFLSIPTLLLLPVSLWLCQGKRQNTAGISKKTDGSLQRDVTGKESGETSDIGVMFAGAVKNKVYRGLMIGFFTCGFHMAIIETHLYTQIVSCGLPENTAALAFSVYGIMTMIGSVLSGMVCSRIPMGKALGFLYGSRAVMTAVFILAPKNTFVVYGFTALLGLTGNATVVPTSGLVSKHFGADKLAMLFGFVFFFHQIGSFFSAWIGGIMVSAVGGYEGIWCMNIILALIASFFSFRISES